MFFRSFVLLSLAGCQTRYDLSSVPIIGGTEEQREAVESSLSDFEREAGVGRVQLSEIVFEPLPQPYGGEYQRVRERLVLSESQTLSNIPRMMRHELCHALDRQEGLLDSPQGSFDRFAEALFEGEDPVFDYDKNARGRRSEAFALACERGPFGAAAMADPCEGEDDLASDLAAYVLENAWSAYTIPEAWPEISEPHASYETEAEPWGAFEIEVTEIPTVFVLSLGYADRGVEYALDVHTGAEERGDFSPHEIEAPWPDLPSGEYSAWVGEPDGTAAATGSFPIRNLDVSYRERLLARRDDRWALVGRGCVEKETWQRALFEADGGVWYAWGDGREVSWADLPPQ